MVVKRPLLNVLLYCALAIFASSMLIVWYDDVGWHDQQRIFQIALLWVVALVAWKVPLRNLNLCAFSGVSLLFLLGAMSSLCAKHPAWAFIEWARYLGLFLLALLVGQLAREFRWQQYVVHLVGACAVLSVFQFLVSYLTVVFSGMHFFTAEMLFGGFSNPRFLAQFQVLAMPALAWLTLYHFRFCGRLNSGFAVLFFCGLVVQWCLALSLAGRGLWLGLMVSSLLLVVVFPRFWRLLVVQVVAALAGALSFYLLFRVVPDWLGAEVLVQDSLRMGLSNRDVIWRLAWDMATANPWLGVGPMHFSAIVNSVAAHPHQVVLQWLSEWGVGATLIALLLGGVGVWHALSFLRQQDAQDMDASLWLSILGALVLAQVDGIFVMPYVETWLAIFLGLALARWPGCGPDSNFQVVSLRLMTLPVLVILGYVLFFDVPHLQENTYQQLTENGKMWAPRFWGVGWIPWND